MWHTSEGERILSGAESELIRDVVSWLHDQVTESLEMGRSYEVGVGLFDQLQPTQQLMMLLETATGLLDPAQEPLPSTAIREATVYAIYRELFKLIVFEVDISRLDGESTCEIRSQAIAAFEQGISEEEFDPSDGTTEDGLVPAVSSTNLADWEYFVEALADRVLWDRDFEMEYLTADLDPDRAHFVRSICGISDDYYSHVADDPPPNQLGNLHRKLHELTLTY